MVPKGEAPSPQWGVQMPPPLLEQTGQTVTYWKLRLHLYRAKTYTSDRLSRLQRSLNIEDEGTQELAQVEIQLQTAWKDLRLVQSNARKHRNSHMEVLADHFAATRDTNRAIELKKIQTI